MIPDQQPPAMLLDLPSPPLPTRQIEPPIPQPPPPQQHMPPMHVPQHTPIGLMSGIKDEEEEFMARLSEDSSVGSLPPVAQEGEQTNHKVVPFSAVN